MSSFAITSATNSVRLEERQGEAVYTVFNGSGRPIRGRARLVPEDPAAAAWLRLEGEAERAFPIAGAEQYRALVSVPDDVPAGSYTFRLDVVNIEQPDEDYVEGPSVTFVVPEPAPPPPFPWWMVAAGGGVLVVVVLLGWWLWPRTDAVVVPDVRGMTTVRAATEIGAAGLQLADSTGAVSSEAYEAGLVAETHPAVGEEVEPGTAVVMVLSTGPPQVGIPEVRGDSLAIAFRKIYDVGLVPSGPEWAFSGSVDKGLVSGTRPSQDEEVNPGSTVTLILSQGPRNGGGFTIDSALFGEIIANDRSVIERMFGGNSFANGRIDTAQIKNLLRDRGN